MSVEVPPVVILLQSDPHLRRLLASQLRRCRYAVVEASSGNDVIEQVVESLVYEDDCKRPSLVISDIQLDSGNGLSIPQTMRVVKYDVPVLLMAVFPEPTIEARAAQIQGCQLISIPFDLLVFLETARAMISSARRNLALRQSS
ncbi:MAG TPA: response regulator [Polyangiaceae bacterium]|jgi:DNA-binding response OmpR family regulator|nr:response regulator [Polyangiaceae bacterium]